MIAGLRGIDRGCARCWPAAGGPTVEDVVWTQVVGCTASGNDLTKTAATGWGNAGAVSTRAILSGDGYVQWTVPGTNNGAMAGLSNGNSDSNYTDIDFAILSGAAPDGTKASIWEKGVWKAGAAIKAYAAGSVFKVSVESLVVKFYFNGTLWYTSLVSPTFPLLVDCAVYTQGASINDAVIYGTLGASGY